MSSDGGWAPRWSPDGRNIAFVRPQRGLGAAVGTTVEIAVTAPDGAGEQVLAVVPVRVRQQPNWVCWTPDRGGVLYLATDADGRAGLWVVQLAGGPPERLLAFDSTIHPSAAFAVLRDTVYVTVESEDRGIRLAELSRGR